MRTHALVLISIGLAIPAPLAAQSLPETGERIRVTRADGGVVEGELRGVWPDSLRLLDSPRGPEFSIPRSEIESVQTSLGRHRRFAQNFFATVAIAAFGTGLASAVTHEPCEGWCILSPDSRGQAFTWGFVGGAVLGVPIGAILGLAITHERWTTLEVHSPEVGQLSVLPVVGPRPGIALSFRPRRR